MYRLKKIINIIPKHNFRVLYVNFFKGLHSIPLYICVENIYYYTVKTQKLNQI